MDIPVHQAFRAPNRHEQKRSYSHHHKVSTIQSKERVLMLLQRSAKLFTKADFSAETLKQGELRLMCFKPKTK
jgi:hypothetical protein